METLTKDEVLPNVRTKTFKVTVKPAQYEMALSPEVWPYRVGVRHFRAPRRSDGTWSSQSGRAGGLVDRGDRAGGQGGTQVGQQGGLGGGQGAGQAGGQGGGARSATGQNTVGHPRYKQSQQRQMMEQHLPDPVQISNLFGILGQLGSLEMPTH